MLGYAHVIVIIHHTTAVGRSTRPLRGSVQERRVTGAGGGDLGAGGRSTKAAEEESGWKGIAGKGRADESTRLSFVVQMLAATVGAGRGS